MKAQRPEELRLARLYDDDICVHVHHSTGLFKFKLTPDQANKLAYRLMSYAAGGGDGYETIFKEGEGN